MRDHVKPSPAPFPSSLPLFFSLYPRFPFFLSLRRVTLFRLYTLTWTHYISFVGCRPLCEKVYDFSPTSDRPRRSILYCNIFRELVSYASNVSNLYAWMSILINRIIFHICIPSIKNPELTDSFVYMLKKSSFYIHLNRIIHILFLLREMYNSKREE